MSEQRVSAVLHDAGAETWAAAVAHPMVREIAAGTLPHETFRGYFRQNVQYLEAYARAIGLAQALRQGLQHLVQAAHAGGAEDARGYPGMLQHISERGLCRTL